MNDLDPILVELRSRADESRVDGEFFRDEEAFASLAELLRSHTPLHRVWVPACGTGEAAYSIAMLIEECAGERPVRIFATDGDARAIDRARSGRFGELWGLSAARVERFFRLTERRHAIATPLRNRIMFATQHLFEDLPLGRIDLIWCSGLLARLDAERQAQLLRTFHGALEPTGLVFVEGARSNARFGELFEPACPRRQIYRRRKPHGLGFLPPGSGQVVASSIDEEAVKRELDARRALSTVVVDSEGVVVYTRGPVDRLLMRVDAADIRMIANPALANVLCHGLDRAVTERDVLLSNIVLDLQTTIELSIHRMVEPALVDHYAIVFEQLPPQHDS